MTTGTDDAGTDGAGTESTETERRWLLDRPPPAHILAGARRVEIEQHYMPTVKDGDTSIEQRVRKTTRHSETGVPATRWCRTTKTVRDASRLTRGEDNVDIGENEWFEAVRTAGGATIIKTRWEVEHDGQLFEVDEFHTPIQAWVAELETDVTTSGTARLPGWAAGAVEITEDARWSNAAIAATARQPR